MSHMSSTPSGSRRDKQARRSGEFPAAPEPLSVPVFDSHTHLDLTIQEAGVPGDGAGDPVDALIDAAAKSGIDRLVQVGVDGPSSRWGAELAARNEAILATVAIHPNEAPRLSDMDEALREIEALAGQPRVRGVGETGLDTFRTGADGRHAQEESFRAHIAIAKRHGKTLVVHDRDAHEDILRILAEEGAPEHTVLHCFSGDIEMARECVERGYLLSFSGTVTFKNARELRNALSVTPMEHLLVETDAPYLTPAPHRGATNAPYLVPLTVRAMAGVLNVDVPTLCTAVAANSERVYGPW